MRKTFFVLAILVLLLAACGGGGGAAPAPSGGSNVANGEKLFKQTVLSSQAGCITCHSLDGSKLVGPTMKGIAGRAANEVPGKSAEEYLKESILKPNDHVVDGYPAGVMQAYQLSEQELNDLVAYLLTLK